MEEQKLFLLEHNVVGNATRFEILRKFLSESFSFWGMLERKAVTIEIDMTDEDDDHTSYLITVSGTGMEPGSWTGELSIEDDDVSFVSGDGDLTSVTPESIKEIILFQVLYGYQE